MAKRPVSQLPDLPPSIIGEVPRSHGLLVTLIPHLTEDLQTLAQQLDEVRQSSDHMRIARAFVALHRISEMLKAILGSEDSPGVFKSMFDRYKTEAVPEAFENAGVDKTVKLAEGCRVTVSPKLYASIPAPKRLDSFEWLRSHNLGDLIIETVNASTLSSTAMTMMEEGKELPADLFSIHIKNNTSVTWTK